MGALRLSLAGVMTLALIGGLVGSVVAESEEPEVAAFPTGRFATEDGSRTLEFRGDGTCERSGVPCTYGVTRNVFSEMTFEDPSGEQVPGTYYWDFDGELLTFEPWGQDRRPGRQSLYAEHAFHPVGETQPLPATKTDLPIGVFVPVGGSETPQMSFRENGTYTGHGWVGKYVVNGDLYTEMTHNSDIAAKVPATYRWHWDGEQLSFRVWGEDPNPWRRSLLGHVFVKQVPLLGDVRVLLLSHPGLDVWVTVELRQREDGRYTAAAAIDEEPLGEGVGDTPPEAVRAALQALGEPYASEIADSVKS